jgi:dTDP-4-amino-4,6-dideoxygalactose transaminase/N-acetylglutamate synthase-like GNAT family acetyltransferase
MITQGKKVDEFEENLKKYFNYPYILTVNSATSGLTLAYKLCNLTTADVVISTPLTCLATNVAIIHNNLNIKWADTDPNTCNIDLTDAENKLTEEVRALSFVHWGGCPVDPDKVYDIKARYREKYNRELHVIEDCAHAFGGEYDTGRFAGSKIGTTGNISVFSLQAIKHLTTGDGGLIFLPTKELYDRAKLLRWYGVDRNKRSLEGKDFRLEPDVPELGFKYHMNDINASIGLGNLPAIPDLLSKARYTASIYTKTLQGLSSIKLLQTIGIPSYWIYTLKVRDGHKNAFIKYLGEAGIVTSQVHARNDNHSSLGKYKTHLPQLDNLEREIVSIPVGWWVNSAEMAHIISTIKNFEMKLLYGYTIRCINPIRDFSQYHKLIELLVGELSFSPNQLSHIPGTIYLLEKDNEIVATARLVIEEKQKDPIGRIEDVVTRVDSRGKGYGSCLVKYLTDKAMDSNCYKITLICKPDLQSFYEKCGFTEKAIALTSRAYLKR